MRAIIIAAVTLISLAAIFAGIGISHRDVPGRTPYLVNDYAGVLDAGTKQYLEGLLKNVRDNSPIRTEIIVTTIKSLNGKSFDRFFSQYLAGWWRWSIAENHNRIQIVIVADEGRIRIGIGRALEKVIDNSTSGDIMRRLMFPSFSDNDYSSGTRAGVEAIVKILEKR